MIPKFRVWLTDIDQMLRVKALVFEKDKTRCVCGYSFDFYLEDENATIMQSTGLVDKNGKEIFDGDIVRTTRFLGRADEIGGFYEYEKDYVGVVKVLEGSWVIDTGIVAVRLWSEIDESEVLGNIYENPEFLEDKK